MKSKFTTSFLLLILAIIFTIGLTFASIELPSKIDNFIGTSVTAVNVYTGGGELQEIKTQLFIQHYHLRTIGYICLFLILLLIIIGFLTEKTGYTTLGAFAIFLPVFGHFAATMFFLGGLGFLRLIWLPGLDVSFNIMKIADAVFIPYRIIIDLFNLVGIDLNNALPYILIFIGLLIFCFATLIWFQTYYNKNGIATHWIYKYSRHPQYLGWIIWSYGILFLPGVNMKQSYSISDSLPWLLSTLIIIGVAMVEEIKMGKLYKGKYDEYRKKSYFMIPMTKYFCRVLSAPFKTFFNKPFPTRKREIIIVLSFYFSIIVLLTVLLNTAAEMKIRGKWTFETEETRNISQLTKEFLDNPKRREKDYLAKTLVAKGDSAIPTFIDLLSNPDPIVREFSADALGNVKSEDAAKALITALNDKNYKVVRSVLNSLGNYKTDSVIESLLSLLSEDNLQQTSLVAGALVKIGNKKSINAVIPYAEKGLIEPNINFILALRNSGTKNAEKLIEKYLSHKDENLRQAAV
ncbi:MAG: HEAT repeat domain-containing protein, partial [Melioribacteraceae bacterium]|nr:HEAT repeat domain-containing protein [Melioribacteraceae bacterium]